MERAAAARSQMRGGGGGRDLSPEREKEPSQPGAPLDLSLSAHFCLRQKKRGRPAELGGDMMLTWDGFLDHYLQCDVKILLLHLFTG